MRKYAISLQMDRVLHERTGEPLKRSLFPNKWYQSRWLAIYGQQHVDIMGLQETLDGAKKNQGDSRLSKVRTACVTCGKVALDGVIVDDSR